MKKITVISIAFNLVLLSLSILLYCRFYELKKEMVISKNNLQVEKKEIKLNISDPSYIYNSKKFSCDSSANSTYESNMCIGEKLEFADSLLTNVLKSKFILLDKYIKIDKEVIVKDKGNTFFTNALKINIAKKENLIKSQRLWEQMRVLNSENVKLGCDGATGCAGIIGKAEIKYVLERIEKIRDIKGNN
ncbi:hypothetical protein [Flavobacterium aquidurense]|uniref:hypothetical protein n=1 Tax=Flavobacterium aquidurense TaxID=362413 RepID=UPI0028574ACE|nr:hypothetical protein [Flavobacterium aquidurense]MDR7370781.1 hypothetical protein [Flavobacterium aquidurense]